MSYRQNITLTPEQRDLLDGRVYSCICDGVGRQKAIVIQLDPWMVATLPKRPERDRFRYVDHAIIRLKRQNKIKLAGPGQGWRSTGAS